MKNNPPDHLRGQQKRNNYEAIMEKELNLDNKNHDRINDKLKNLTFEARMFLLYALSKDTYYECTKDELMKECNMEEYPTDIALDCLEKFKFVKKVTINDLEVVYCFHYKPFE